MSSSFRTFPSLRVRRALIPLRTHTSYSASFRSNFRAAFDTRFMKFMGRAVQRRACSLRGLGALQAPDLRALAGTLRAHASEHSDFSRHGNADVCMHAGGVLRPSQTTGSMLVGLAHSCQATAEATVRRFSVYRILVLCSGWPLSLNRGCNA